MPERVCQQPFSRGKERWAVTTSSKLKIIELLSSISSFQDGRPQPSKGISKKANISYNENKFYGEVRPAGCIFQCFIPQRKQGICTIPTGRETFRICVPLFWVGYSSSNLHKTLESANIFDEQDTDWPSDLF